MKIFYLNDCDNKTKLVIEQTSLTWYPTTFEQRIQFEDEIRDYLNSISCPQKIEFQNSKLNALETGVAYSVEIHTVANGNDVSLICLPTVYHTNAIVADNIRRQLFREILKRISHFGEVSMQLIEDYSLFFIDETVEDCVEKLRFLNKDAEEIRRLIYENEIAWTAFYRQFEHTLFTIKKKYIAA